MSEPDGVLGTTPTAATVEDTKPAATEEAHSAAAVPPPAKTMAVEERVKAEQASKPGAVPAKPYDRLLSVLPELLKESDYDEVYGVKLTAGGDLQTSIILQKFLRANANDVDTAKQQLIDTLKWRKQFQPLKAKDEIFGKERFDGLGYVIEVDSVPGSQNKKDVVTFNIYGGVKNNKNTFEDIPGFIRWRVGLMELGLSKLDLAAATQSIPDYGAGPDPYQGIQVHDYLNVSFLRQDPHVKKASKAAIETFSKYYPETLSRKFFVNVPAVMGWLFSAMKLVLSKETVKKFTVLSYGDQLATDLGQDIPKVYGGNKDGLDAIGEGLKLE